MRRITAMLGFALLSACATAPHEPAYVFPEGLKIMSEGYPLPDGPCRLLGETFATSELLDDSADLLGCPPGAMQDSRVASVGRVVGEFEGVILVSVPRSATNPTPRR